ncbi:MAG: DUF4056 domain-containing protein [Bacteroidia bacterium]
MAKQLVHKLSENLAVVVFIVLLHCNFATAQQIERSLQGLEIEPFGRMIRPCCVFGYNLPVFGFPAKMGYTTSSEKLGKHKFYGGDGEVNGIIYTRDGGFIDIGHLRDNADVVAYFASEMVKNACRNFVMKTNNEAGKRVIEFKLEGQALSSSDMLILAQRITYELAVWHEIRTYFGVPTHYPIHEVQSAFSPEDLYSNLLGTYVGRWAIERNGLYEQEVDSVIQEFLARVGKVKTEEDTKAAMDNVLNVWWKRVSLPSKKFLLAHNTVAYGTITPWLIPGHAQFFPEPGTVYPLDVPEYTEGGLVLNNLFTIRIKPISKIPLKKIFPNQNKKEITQKDFPGLIKWIEEDLKP